MIPLKKLSKIAFSLLFIFVLTQNCLANENKANQIELNDSLRLSNIVLTLLMPEIQNAVNTFYSPYLKELPKVEPFLELKGIVDISGGELIHQNILNSYYVITVEVLPFLGAHNSVGKDRIILNITNKGIVTVEKYTHIESYELMPNLQNLIIKPLP